MLKIVLHNLVLMVICYLLELNKSFICSKKNHKICRKKNKLVFLLDPKKTDWSWKFGKNYVRYEKKPTKNIWKYKKLLNFHLKLLQNLVFI